MGAQAFDSARSQIFHLDADNQIVIVGLDTKDGPEHVLWDDRINLPLDEDLVENLLLLRKVLEPVSVRKNGDVAEVVYGRQRVRCVREANKRLLAQGAKTTDLIKVPCIIERATDADLIRRMYSENAQRREDSPMARARHIQRFMEFGNSPEVAAKVFRLKPASIKEQVTLLDLDKSVQKMVDGGQLGATAALSLVTLSFAEQKTQASKLVESGQTTVAEVKHAVRQQRAVSRGGSAEDVVRAPSKRAIRRAIEANESLPKSDQLDPEFIRGLRVAIGDLDPRSIKGLTGMMSTEAEAAE